MTRTEATSPYEKRKRADGYPYEGSFVMRRHIVLWLLSISGLSIALGTIAALTGGLQHNVGATTVCPTDWVESTDQNVTRSCSILAETTKSIEDTQYRQAQLTHVALNPQIQSYTPPPSAVTETPDPPLTTPVVQVHAEDKHDFVDGSAPLRHTSSIWTLGKVRGRETYDIDTLYVITRAPTTHAYTTLSIVVDGSDIGPNSWPQYNGTWHVPQAMGTMQITAITGVSILDTGLTGTATFTTDTGASGTFDLASHAWTITVAGTPQAQIQNVPTTTPTSTVNVTPTSAASAPPTATPASYPAP